MTWSKVACSVCRTLLSNCLQGSYCVDSHLKTPSQFLPLHPTENLQLLLRHPLLWQREPWTLT